MRSLAIALLAAALASPASAPLCDVSAATVSGSSTRSFAPVVVESFSVAHPRAGQHVVVNVRFLNNNRPVAGARLSATLRLGKKILETVHGSTTDRNGNAHAGFAVPKSASGKTLRVAVSLSYRGRTYPGRDDLKVQA